MSDGAAVAAGDHQCRAQYRLMTISASCTKPWGAPHTDLGNIGHLDDHTVLGGHRRLSQVVGRQGKAVCPNDQAFARTLDETRASLDVGAFQCLDQIGQTQVVCRQSSAVGVDAVFLDVPTHRINTGQAGAGAHLWCDDPVLDSTQVRCALLGGSKTIALWCQVDLTLLPASLAGLGQLLGVEWLEVHRPHENLAQPGCNRGEHGGHALGQISGSLPHPLCHLLAGKIDVGLISEDRRDLREAIARQGTSCIQTRDAGQGRLQRIGNLAFNLLRCEGRCNCIDLNLAVGDIWYSIDWQLAQLEQAKAGDQCSQKHHEPAELDRCFNDDLEHGV